MGKARLADCNHALFGRSAKSWPTSTPVHRLRGDFGLSKTPGRVKIERGPAADLWMGLAFGADLVLAAVVLAVLGAGERGTKAVPL